MTDIDTVPLLADPGPWWAPKGTNDRTPVTLNLPAALVDRLAKLEPVLGIAASDLAAFYIERGSDDAILRRSRMLGDIDDHFRIKGWLPDGTPRLDHDDIDIDEEGDD